MKKILLLSALVVLFGSQALKAQGSETAAKKYIEKYKDLAMEEQARVGIPAAITLAQGLLESAFGGSMLATEANNHFGIKCKNTWTGETILHDDDAMSECFRKYKTALDSYKDHSDYLRNNRRYSFLFDIPLLKYQEWASGLRKAGYATDENYAKRLTDLIEKYKLQDYTIQAQANYVDQAKIDRENAKAKAEKDAEAKKQEIIAKRNEKRLNDSLDRVERLAKLQLEKELKKKAQEEKAAIAAQNDGNGFATAKPKKEKKVDEPKENKAVGEKEKVTKSSKKEAADKETSDAPKKSIDESEFILNGLKGFYANKGDLLLQEAVARDIRYPKLLQMNDLEDKPLPQDMFIYLEKKHKTSPNKRAHIVREGETLLGIAQLEGIQLSSLRELNMLEKDEVPAAGARLSLQEKVSRKPQILMAKTTPVVSKPTMSKPKDMVIAVEKKEDENVADLIFDDKQDKQEVKENEKINEVATSNIESQEQEIKVATETKPFIRKEDPIISTTPKVVVEAPKVNTEELKEAQMNFADEITKGGTAKQEEIVVAPVKEKKSEPIKDVSKPGKKVVVKEVEIPVIASPRTAVDTVKTNTIVSSTMPVIAVAPPRIFLKSPSNYEENGVSPELRRLKKIMDGVVYAPMPERKVIPKPIVVPNPSIKTVPKVTPKTTTTVVSSAPKVASTAKKDTIAKINTAVKPKPQATTPATVKTASKSNTNPKVENAKSPAVKSATATKTEPKADATKNAKAPAKPDPKTPSKTAAKTDAAKGSSTKAATSKTEVKTAKTGANKPAIKKEAKPTPKK